MRLLLLGVGDLVSPFRRRFGDREMGLNDLLATRLDSAPTFGYVERLRVRAKSLKPMAAAKLESSDSTGPPSAPIPTP
jgi:hypothetical protein